ncbi:hypothetical protein ACROYT_G015489 [Oculina patagonica]
MNGYCRRRTGLRSRCKVFRNKSHHSLHKHIKLYNDIETNPGPTYLTESNTISGTFHQGNEFLFGVNSGKQCVANSLVAIVFNAASSCFVKAWDSAKMDKILLLGNALYSHIHSSIGKDFLLLNELPSALALDHETYRLFYSESISGDVNMLQSEECYFSLSEALNIVKAGYSGCLLTIFCNTVAILFGDNRLKLFDSHSRDACGNACSEGTSVLLEFSRKR